MSVERRGEGVVIGDREEKGEGERGRERVQVLTTQLKVGGLDTSSLMKVRVLASQNSSGRSLYLATR